MARRVYRKKRSTRRAYRKRGNKMPRKMIKNNNVYITRVTQLEDFTIQSNFAWTHREYQFTLQDLPSYSEFTGLFNQYKISAVKLTFFPQYDSIDSTGSTYSNIAGEGVIAKPVIFTTYTTDDTVLLGSQATAMQVSSAKMVRDTLKPFSIYCKPKIQVEASTSLGFAAVMPSSGWLDTDNYGAKHYGAQIGGRTFAASTASSPNMSYQCFAKYYLQLKNAR